MAAELQSVSPILAVASVSETAEYYKECFGFEILFVMEDDSLPGYAVVERGDSTKAKWVMITAGVVVAAFFIAIVF